MDPDGSYIEYYISGFNYKFSYNELYILFDSIADAEMDDVRNNIDKYRNYMLDIASRYSSEKDKKIYYFINNKEVDITEEILNYIKYSDETVDTALEKTFYYITNKIVSYCKNNNIDIKNNIKFNHNDFPTIYLLVYVCYYITHIDPYNVIAYKVDNQDQYDQDDQDDQDYQDDQDDRKQEKKKKKEIWIPKNK